MAVCPWILSPLSRIHCVCTQRRVHVHATHTADTRADMHAPTGSPPGLLRSSDAQLCGGLFVREVSSGPFRTNVFLSLCVLFK